MVISSVPKAHSVYLRNIPLHILPLSVFTEINYSCILCTRLSPVEGTRSDCCLNARYKFITYTENTPSLCTQTSGGGAMLELFYPSTIPAASVMNVPNNARTTHDAPLSK